MGVGRRHREARCSANSRERIDDLVDADRRHRRRDAGRVGTADRAAVPGAAAGRRRRSPRLTWSSLVSASTPCTPASAARAMIRTSGDARVAGERGRVGGELLESRVPGPACPRRRARRTGGRAGRAPARPSARSRRARRAGRTARATAGPRGGTGRRRWPLETLVLGKAQQAAEQVGPADHRQVDDHHGPQPLPSVNG